MKTRINKHLEKCGFKYNSEISSLLMPFKTVQLPPSHSDIIYLNDFL